MSAYDSIDYAKAGLMDGLDRTISTLAVQPADSFDFGDPTFMEEGEPELAELGDNSNANLVFAGVAVISHRSDVETQGEYPEYDAMNVLERGRVWVKSPDAEAALGIAGKSAYVVDLPTDADYGKFSSIDTWYGSVGLFRSNPTLVGSDYLAIVELHGVQMGAASNT